MWNAKEIQALHDELEIIEDQLRSFSRHAPYNNSLPKGEQLLYQFLVHRKAKLLDELIKLSGG
jgi:hypothetical protein